MMKIRRLPQPLLIFVLLLILVACAPPTPIPVYITPTPQPPTTIPSQVSTLEPLVEVTISPVVGEPTQTQMIVGAVVGADYTLQPSNTPRPTRTPLATVPPRPSDTSVPVGPSATPTIPPSPTVSPTPLPQLDGNRVGVQLFTDMGRQEWDDSLSRATELGVGWIKVQASWAFLQPNGYNPDEERLRTFELNLQTADQRGFKILMSVAKAPPYVRSNTGDDAPPDNPQTLVDFLNMLFQQTKIGEVVDAIEIWNEPNLKREWNTPALTFGGAGYMQLFTPAYQAIRAYRPDMMVVTAGLAPTGTSDFSIDDRDYLRQMYAAGLGQYQDVVIGVHPYGWGNAPDAACCDMNTDRGWDDNPHFFFKNNLDDARATMNANGHQNVQMWITELGWATWQDLSVGLPDPAENNLWMNYISPQTQADYTLKAIQIAQQERTDIGMMFLWNLNFANPLSIQNRQEIVAYSMLMPGQSPRPLFYLLPLALKR
ncbi:MAG TPA: hypothetical protein VHL11_09955 [Phototrophicaceae bacterium]|nr:hypothetical protein [Phototrophicaceae bacterium]